MLFVLLAASLTFGATLLSWSYPWRAARVSARCRKQLQSELDTAQDDSARFAAINESLTSAEHELTRRRLFPRTGAWLSLTGCLLAGIAGYLAGEWSALVWLVPVGVAGMGLCLAASSRGQREAQRQREQIDAFVAPHAKALDESDIPERRQMRWQRKRRR